MKRKLLIALGIVAIFVCGSLVGSPLIAQAQTSFWGGSIPVATTESLVVKSGSTVLPNGYVFNDVELKTGDTKVYTITVDNTGTATWLVKPQASVSNPSYLTAEWSHITGQTIAGGDSADFTLTLTGILEKPDITVTVGFTRE